jgi:arabinogalactan endo-1,4-beta-galactosidase
MINQGGNVHGTRKIRSRLRRALLLGAALAGLAGSATVAPAMAHAQKPNWRDFRVSLSVGPDTDFWFAGGTYYIDGRREAHTTRELQQMLVRNGSTEVWARANTRDEFNTLYDDYSFNTAISRGQLAKSLRLDFNVELMLDRTYGDVACQTPPDFTDYPQIHLSGPWETLRIGEMEAAMRTYGRAVAKRFRASGVDVDTWDIGNETEYGLAGISLGSPTTACDIEEPGYYQAPTNVDPAIGTVTWRDVLRMPEADKIAWLQAHIWPYQARLMRAVEQGIKSVDCNARFSTHMSGLANVTPTFATAFYRALNNGGVKIDESGLSYFPSSPSGLRSVPAFKTLVQTLVREFHRPVFIAETAYPSGPIDDFVGPDEHPFADWDNEIANYPLTPAGQAKFFKDLSAWGLQNRLLSGIRPLYPEVIQYWGPQLSLFDILPGSDPWLGVSKPGLSAIRDGLQHGDPNAFS